MLGSCEDEALLVSALAMHAIGSRERIALLTLFARLPTECPPCLYGLGEDFESISADSET